MVDKREAVLVRLLAIAQSIDGVVYAGRNEADIEEDSRPAILILDADEAADESDPQARPSNSPRRVGMTPEIYILLGSEPENVGSQINALRAKFVKAVLTDTELRTITGTNGGIRYEGCATGLARGRTMEGEMGVSFTFSYVLHPNDL